ncbi:MAG: glycosyltransferase family 39 protein, partial [Planctomycetes bacterium]|nr:glycosyltransferase family 39 protein [Planctomycetota bacterium]
MAAIDDAKLIEMASHCPETLFPVLNRAKPLWLLIIVAAALPALYVLDSCSLDEQSAVRALRAIDVLTAQTAADATAPGQSETARPLRYQPPLATWMTAVAMAILGTAHPIAPMIVSSFIAVALVGMMFAFLQQIGWGRIGFWTAIILSSHPVFLFFILSGTSATLAFFFLAISLWAMIRHTRNGAAPVSFSLLLAGIALGLCLLSGGPIALVGFGLLLVFLFDGKEEPRRAGFNSPKRRANSERMHRLLTPVVLALTAFAVGGWWVMMMATRYGGDFWSEWLRLGTGESLSSAASSPVLPQPLGMRLLWLLGGYAVPALFGVGRAVYLLFQKGDPWQRQRLLFLVWWSLLGAGCWLLNPPSSAGGFDRVTVWDGLLLVPLLILAAFTFEEILQRRVPLAVTVVLACAAIAMFATMKFPVDASGFADKRASTAWIVPLIISVLFGVTVYFSARGHESRIRLAAGVLTLGIAVRGAVWG